jgi:hypothetical protein
MSQGGEDLYSVGVAKQWGQGVRGEEADCYKILQVCIMYSIRLVSDYIVEYIVSDYILYSIRLYSMSSGGKVLGEKKQIAIKSFRYII